METKKTLYFKGKVIEIPLPSVMGIINLTPDSFYDGGRLRNTDEMLKLAEKHIHEGAFMLDVGGCSTRPGASVISEIEEIDRVVEPLYQLCRRFPEVPVSIDTMRKKVAEMAVEAGATLVNDISAGEFDPEMIDFVSEKGIPYIIMHKKGMPSDMQNNPDYQDVTTELLQYFENKIFFLHQKGITDIIIDPGFGFGKTLQHNYTLLKNLSLFRMFNLPVLIGISRKSMIYKALGINPEEALNGTTVLHTIALMNGANILRVHDVREAVETIKLINLFSQK
ncbi:MAG TPA: dihydropteroate synthase [Bacteroidia bacterium]|nr:dihydropteroate synthase [Bacteroidia bacterium]HRS59700.1 dihydropteroate synthase [Bacteroidia bacterium]HRU68693.1 dihydropteroate synthase [Bacteroidia bacterium]